MRRKEREPGMGRLCGLQGGQQMVFECAQPPSTPGHTAPGRALLRRRRRPPDLRAACASLAAGALASLAGSTRGDVVSCNCLHTVPAAVMEGAQAKQYAWDGQQLRALEAGQWERGAARTLRGRLRRAGHDLRAAFLPQPDEVSPDYWQYARYRAWHRLFSSMSSVLATQSLLRAVGVGGRAAAPAAAAINWVLKDGLGRLGRLTVAARFGQSFDSDLKRFRYTTSIIYAASLSLEFLTPLAPQHFLAMASLANVGKSVGLTTFIATQPAFHRSFCLRENLADLSAKTQAQQMVVDNVGLAAAVGLTWLCRRTEGAARALPLLMFPPLAAGDLWAIYSELRSIHLRTLNKERAEIIAQHWLAEGRVPTPRQARRLRRAAGGRRAAPRRGPPMPVHGRPAVPPPPLPPPPPQVSEEERFVLPPHIEAGRMPLVIGSLEGAVRSSQDVGLLERQRRDERYFLTCSAPGSGGSGWQLGPLPLPLPLPWQAGRHAGSVRVCLRQDAAERDIVQAVLQAAYLRQALGAPPAGRGRPGGGGAGGAADVPRAVADSARRARAGLQPLLAQLEAQGWQLTPFMLSSTEKRRYLRL